MGERESGIWVPPGGSADIGPEPQQQQPEPPPMEMPSPEELAEQLRQLKTSDFVLSLIPTLGQLAYAKLDPAALDLAEARVAIDAIRALLSVIEGAVPPDVTRDLQQLVANLQLAYAGAADQAPPPESAGDD